MIYHAARLQSRGEDWKVNARIMLLRWVLLGWCRTITSPRAGRIIPLTPLPALLPATTLEMFWEHCVTLERSVFLPPSTKPGDSVLFFTRFYCFPRYLHHVSRDYFSVISLAQPLAVCMIEGCIVQWTGQIGLFLLLQVLPTSSGIILGRENQVATLKMSESGFSMNDN